ncbi:hypothetical protein G6F50_018211 [Rhizopus delemar]|uniref:Uncharacterized protein n=1 Tax=Rhizopus delemar TaxID=936053 RepID=A0A9P6XNG2_9FUNG|nr:hypothetical protein G6F50_018211 [Rhizopus delemar]
MHADGASAAGGAVAGGCVGAGDAALRGAARGGVPARISRDHARADQQRPHRGLDGASHRYRDPHGTVDGFDLACAALAAGAAVDDGQS